MVGINSPNFVEVSDVQLINFWSPTNWSFATTFHVTKIPELSSEGRTMLSHDNGKKWLLSKASVSSIFDILGQPLNCGEKRGVGFFFDKPKNLRLAKKKTPPPWGFWRGTPVGDKLHLIEIKEYLWIFYHNTTPHFLLMKRNYIV